MEQHESGAGLRRRKGGPAEGAADERAAIGEGSAAEDAAENEEEADVGTEAVEGDAAAADGAAGAASAAGASAEADGGGGAAASAAASARAADGVGPADDSPLPDASPTGVPPPPTQPQGTIQAAFSAELASRIVKDFPSCCSGQFMSAASSQRRFLTTLGVHRSMAVFAWHPGKNPIGFVAHITAGAIRFSLEKRGEMLPEMVKAMRRTFKDVKKADVVVQMVGDFVGEPLKRYLKDLPGFSHVASLHIDAMLRRGGFSNIDKELCAAFEDEAATEPAEGEEPKARPEVTAVGDARRFSLAALDLKTGQVIAQARGTIADVKAAVGDQWPALEAEYERDKDVLRNRYLFSPLTEASGSSADFWTAYYELISHPLPLVLLAIAIVGIFIHVVSVLLPVQWGSNLLFALRNTMVPGIDTFAPKSEGGIGGGAKAPK